MNYIEELEDPLVYYPFPKNFNVTVSMLTWLRDNAKGSQFGYTNGNKSGIFIRSDDLLAFRLRFGI